MSPLIPLFLLMQIVRFNECGAKSIRKRVTENLKKNDCITLTTAMQKSVIDKKRCCLPVRRKQKQRIGKLGYSG